MACILPVAQHCGDAHDGQANPEEIEETMEVTVVTIWVEVRKTRGKLDGREDAPALLGASLLARGGEGLGRGRGIVGDRSRAATEYEEQLLVSRWSFGMEL